MHRTRVVVALWAALFSAFAPRPVAAAGSGAAGATAMYPRIVNGLETRAYPSVGVLLYGTDPDSGSLVCSGTLIGCQTFLTAAHCVEGDPDPAHYFVFLQHAGIFAVTSVTPHPDYEFPVADVAVLKLAASVTGIPPVPINTDATPAPGTAGVIVGFGRAGGADFEYGLKRYGSVITATCSGGISDTTSVCWNFESPLGPPGTDSNTCNGDSGGPLFIDFGSGDRVAGVTSGGVSGSCLPEDVSYDANVFHYRSWIEAVGGADLGNTTCGSIPQIGEAETQVTALSGELSRAYPEELHAVAVPSGTVLLRITMNAVDDGVADFDLYVKAAGAPTRSDFDCKADGANQFGSCEFAGPAATTWYVLISRYAGSGRYQLTVTTFGVDCGDPGNEGAPCDDGNPCTAPDACQGGLCIGAALSDGTACEDGSLCTVNDRCMTGVCVSGASPASDCRLPVVGGKSLLRIDNKTPDTHDKLLWRWLGGSATDVSDFGDPIGGSAYALCVYDEVAGVPQLKVEVPLPTGARWHMLEDGFKYRNRSAKAGGIKSVRLKAGVDGEARITLIAKREELGLGPPTPFHQDGHVVVQLLGAGTCWEARYGASLVNDGTLLKARSD